MSGGYGNNSSGWGDPLVTVFEPFDALLNHSCAVYRVRGGSVNSYGIPDESPVLLLDNIACRISAEGGRSPQPGVEYKVQKQLPKGTYKIFMRPQTIEITPAHSIALEGRWFNITSVLKERGRDNPTVHHLEIFVEEILPSNFTLTPDPLVTRGAARA